MHNKPEQSKRKTKYIRYFFVLSVVGLVFVLYIYLTFVPEEIKIADLPLDKLNHVVAVEGIATNIVKSKFSKEYHDGAFCLCMRNETRAHFTLRDNTGEIDVYLRSSKMYVPQPNEQVKVIGEVSYWEGPIIFAERVEKINNND